MLRGARSWPAPSTWRIAPEILSDFSGPAPDRSTPRTHSWTAFFLNRRRRVMRVNRRSENAGRWQLIRSHRVLTGPRRLKRLGSNAANARIAEVLCSDYRRPVLWKCKAVGLPTIKAQDLSARKRIQNKQTWIRKEYLVTTKTLMTLSTSVLKFG